MKVSLAEGAQAIIAGVRELVGKLVKGRIPVQELLHDAMKLLPNVVDPLIDRVLAKFVASESALQTSFVHTFRSPRFSFEHLQVMRSDPFLIHVCLLLPAFDSRLTYCTAATVSSQRLEQVASSARNKRLLERLAWHCCSLYSLERSQAHLLFALLQSEMR